MALARPRLLLGDERRGAGRRVRRRPVSVHPAPVYTSYILAFLGLLVAFPGWPTAIAFAANSAFYLHAASDEERTLAHSEIGQAYAAHRQGTGMFFPRVGR